MTRARRRRDGALAVRVLSRMRHPKWGLTVSSRARSVIDGFAAAVPLSRQHSKLREGDIMRSRTTVSLLALAVASIVLTGAGPGGAVELPGEVPMAGADFPGAPPAFVLPVGGTAAVDVSPAGRTRYTLSRADGTLFAQAEVDSEGRVPLALWYDERGELFFAATQTLGSGRDAVPAPRVAKRRQAGLGRSAPKAISRPTASCGGVFYTYHPWQLNPSVTFFWHFNAGSTPNYMNVNTTEQYLRNAHIQWYDNSDWCGIADNSVFAMAYGGRTTAVWGNNGISTVGFGNMAATGCSPSAVGCTWADVSGGVVTESDTRFNENYSWINGAANGKYDTWSVMAHELGHTLGFDHPGDSTNVMSVPLFTDDITDQLLGKGDATGNNAKY